MGLDLRKRIIERLRSQPDIQFKARDLAVWIFENYPEECAEKQANSLVLNSEKELIQQIAAEIGSNRPDWQKRHPPLKTTEGRPRRYYWTEKSDKEAEQEANEALDINESAPEQTTSTLHEHALYPLLMQYLATEQQVYSMRIDEKRSSNKGVSGSNEWLHPDLVGIEDLTQDWNASLKQLAEVLKPRRARLWSFEVKLLINRANVRKSFFQTVSNSSWANFGYLVAATIEGDDTLKELQVLSAAHGIGVIQLDSETPIESQILIPARERPTLDWDTGNRLATENKDFVNFLARVKRFHQTGEIIASEWKMQ